MLRRQPVFFLIDASKEMEKYLDNLNKGLRIIVEELAGNPYSLECTFVSTIAFAERAVVLNRLENIGDFSFDDISVLGETADYKAGFDALIYEINNKVNPSTISQKGDWNPLVLFFTAGNSSVLTCQQVFEKWNRKYRKTSSVVTFLLTQNTYHCLLASISDQLFEADLVDDNIIPLFKWISHSIDTRSKAVLNINNAFINDEMSDIDIPGLIKVDTENNKPGKTPALDDCVSNPNHAPETKPEIKAESHPEQVPEPAAISSPEPGFPEITVPDPQTAIIPSSEPVPEPCSIPTSEPPAISLPETEIESPSRSVPEPAPSPEASPVPETNSGNLTDNTAQLKEPMELLEVLGGYISLKHDNNSKESCMAQQGNQKKKPLNKKVPDEIEFSTWLMEKQHISYSTSIELTAAIKSAERFADTRMLPSNKLYTNDIDEAKTTANVLFSNKEFIQYNYEHNNLFFVAISKLFRFYGEDWDMPKLRDECETPGETPSPKEKHPDENPSVASFLNIALASQTRRVCNMIFTLEFYQKEPVGNDKTITTYNLYFTDCTGKHVSDITQITADRTSNNEEERKIKIRFTLKNIKFDATKTYYLLIENESGNRTCLEKFKIDIPTASGDFGDFFD